MRPPMRPDSYVSRKSMARCNCDDGDSRAAAVGRPIAFYDESDLGATSPIRAGFEAILKSMEPGILEIVV
jgi:hypothetical protein